ncbi:hypothetical protein BCR44DRAFT_1137424 [Catenaria anguillulae PL171]|uniref:SET domain-containing protein n=1 Tax=Catenaria anguillulae PL171 TaxID=765915 RepID=A0A1Y2HP66_9FUNG|nr:hypothetical protein BCR44DRAFT_1137424 [Catenaria anguillulae PL171]
MTDTMTSLPPTSAALVAPSYKPTHPEQFKVHFGENLSSKLITTRAYAKDEVIAKIEGTTFAAKRYTTVQTGIDEHVELNSDLVYMNHSCGPSCVFDTDAMVVRATRDLVAGDEMTFFYPSSEWDMDQPFACWCSAPNCVKMVQGAKYLTESQLEGQAVMSHIRELRKTALGGRQPRFGTLGQMP